MKRLLFASLVALSSFANADWRGALITSPDQLEEISSFSNSFSYVPEDLESLKTMLDVNDGALMPAIELGWYFFDRDDGIFKDQDVQPLLQAIGKHKIMIFLDEPFWWIRMACQEGKPLACAEIDNDYKNTREFFKHIKLASGFQMFHVEAFMELILQKQSHPERKVIMLESADHIGFNCYGEFDNCHGHHQMQYAAWVYDAMRPHQKMFLVPGAFDYTTDNHAIIEQLEEYFNLYNMYRNILSAIHIFTWGGFKGMTGARDIPEIKQKVIDLFGTIDG